MYAEPLDNNRSAMTEAEYLAFADEQELKHEYHDGHVIAMSGGSIRHGVITVNASTHLNILLRDSDCSVTSSDVRVYIAFKQTYRYPDITVFCEEPVYRSGRTDTLINPVLLVEVLSPRTALTDRNEKLAEYTRIDSLQAYLLISQDEPKVEVFQRHESNRWLYEYATGIDAAISTALFGSNLRLSLSEIYRRIRWDEAENSDEVSSTADNE